jgi:hypothetical protein
MNALRMITITEINAELEVKTTTTHGTIGVTTSG